MVLKLVQPIWQSLPTFPMDIEGEVSLSYFNFHMPVPCSPLLTGNLYQAHSA